MERTELKNTSKRTNRQLLTWAVSTGAFLGIVIYLVLNGDGSSSDTSSLIFWSTLLFLMITFPIFVFTYLRPHRIVLDRDGITLVSLFRRRTIPARDLREVYDWGRRENRRGERVIYYADKRYDMHWLGVDVQDRIIENYRIPVRKKG